MREKLEPLALELIGKHHMCWLGGDHSITLPLLRAYRKHYGRPLALIHFDAHCDTCCLQSRQVNTTRIFAMAPP